MNSEDKSYLKTLVQTHGTPGYEQKVQKVFRERVKDHCDSVETDLMGSVIAVKNSSGSPRLLLDGHADEIGFMVTYIDDNGFIYFTPSGGWDLEVVVSQTRSRSYQRWLSLWGDRKESHPSNES